MTLMKPFLIVLTILMLMIGTFFLILYFINAKKYNKENEKEVLNQKLNLYLAILILIGAVVVGTFIVMIY